MTLIGLVILIIVVSLIITTMDKQKAKKPKQITVQEQPTKVETVVVQDPELLEKAGMFMTFIDRIRDEIDQTGCVNEADFDRIWKETKGGL